jgi:hypothetical protein
MYCLSKTTNISDLSKRDMDCLSSAINAAQNSCFESSKKLGACLLLKGAKGNR